MAIKRNMVAGILLTLAVSIVAKLLSPYLPSLGGEALAMLMGIVLGNTLFAHERWNAGVKWAEKYPIEIVNLAGIGLNLKWATIKSSGATFLGYGLVTIIFQVVLALGLITLLMH